jgi:flagellar hook-length control protein FliK
MDAADARSPAGLAGDRRPAEPWARPATRSTDEALHADDAERHAVAARASSEVTPSRSAAAIRAFSAQALGEGTAAPHAASQVASTPGAPRGHEQSLPGVPDQTWPVEEEGAPAGTRDGAPWQRAPRQHAQDAPRQGAEPNSDRDAASRPVAPAAPSAVPLLRGADGVLPAAFGLPTPEAGATVTPQQRAENVARLVQSMRVLVRDGVSEATVHLRPEHLGDVRIAIRLDGRTVLATVHAESAGVREWLHAQESTLRAGLAERGLDLDRLVVERDPRHERREPPPDPPRLRPRRDPDAEERFVVSA